MQILKGVETLYKSCIFHFTEHKLELAWLVSDPRHFNSTPLKNCPVKMIFSKPPFYIAMSYKAMMHFEFESFSSAIWFLSKKNVLQA